jgi:uncharacterized phage protein (TIGR01671 family)
MNRPIKFRAWSKEPGHMIPNVHRSYDWEYLPKDGSEDDNFVFMQFTGMLDMFGYDIYEGDIVRLYWKKMPLRNYVVDFENGTFFLQRENQKMAMHYIGGSWEYSEHTMEVLGNVYENKSYI